MENQTLVTVSAVHDGQPLARAHMEEGSSLIVGNSNACGLAVSHPSISERHSILRWADGVLALSDWHSDAGTFVNDEQISAEVTLQANDRVRLGEIELQVAFPAETTEKNPSALPLQSAGASGEAATDSATESAATTTGKPLAAKPNVLVQQLEKQLAELTEENRQLQEELENQLSMQSDFGSTSSTPEVPADWSDENNAAQLGELQDEVIRLEAELAERERELDEWASQGEAIVDPSETAALVDRLEKLLEELGQADHRVNSLEDLLRASDEAHAAELEERKQITNWLDEIESRVAQRDHEWQAQIRKLQGQLELATSQLKKSEAGRVQDARAAGDEHVARLETQVVELREECRDLAGQLQNAHEQIETLEQKNRELSGETEDGEIPHAFREFLRTKELELAQERAELARAKAELGRLQQDPNPKMQVADAVGNSDIRVRALREHLKEIHDQEEQEKSERKNNRSLASRIASLWQRLDG